MVAVACDAAWPPPPHAETAAAITSAAETSTVLTAVGRMAARLDDPGADTRQAVKILTA